MCCLCFQAHRNLPNFLSVAGHSFQQATQIQEAVGTCLKSVWAWKPTHNSLNCSYLVVIRCHQHLRTNSWHTNSESNDSNALLQSGDLTAPPTAPRNHQRPAVSDQEFVNYQLQKHETLKLDEIRPKAFKTGCTDKAASQHSLHRYCKWWPWCTCIEQPDNRAVSMAEMCNWNKFHIIWHSHWIHQPSLRHLRERHFSTSPPRKEKWARNQEDAIKITGKWKLMLDIGRDWTFIFLRHWETNSLHKIFWTY